VRMALRDGSDGWRYARARLIDRRV
jgi:hypothetical protein